MRVKYTLLLSIFTSVQKLNFYFLLLHFYQFDLKVQLFSCHFMICIKSNGLFCFVSDFYREWLAHLVCQIYLLAYSQILRAWKLLDLQFKDSIRVWLSVCFFKA